jgi:hypothetical protein
MHVRSLGPHTFITPPSHDRRPDWLAKFNSRQRRELIEDDYHARLSVFAVMIGAMLFGLATLVLAVATAM